MYFRDAGRRLLSNVLYDVWPVDRYTHHPGRRGSSGGYVSDIVDGCHQRGRYGMGTRDRAYNKGARRRSTGTVSTARERLPRG